MKRKLICLLLLLAFVLAGCSKAEVPDYPVSNEQKYLTRLNFYSASGKLLDQYRIEYDPTGMPVKISSGIMPDQQFESQLGGAPMLPAGVKLDQADGSSYKSVLLAPCDEGTALLVAGTAQEPLWGMVLYGDAENYASRNRVERLFTYCILLYGVLLFCIKWVDVCMFALA